MALATCSVVSELMAQGRESAAVLEALLQGGPVPAHSRIRELATEILRCCDRALDALHGGGGGADAITAAGSDDAGAGVSRKRKPAPGGTTSQMRPKRRARTSGGEIPTRVEKKWTAEDGFIWRKYGQKDIQNSKHPRLYFRCTYKHDSGCPATRQVQQSEDDPSLYVITYFGDHTCCGDAAITASVGDDGETQPFVINFGSAATSTGSPAWLSSSVDDDVRKSETSRSSQAVRLPVEDREELRLKVTKAESTSDSQPAAGLSSSADVSCSSPAWDPLPGCSDWDYFGESSFDYITEFIDLYEIPIFQ